MDDSTNAVVVAPVVDPVVAPVADEGETVADTITQKDEEIAKLKDVVDNYKNVALKRLGKLPGDADFLAGQTESGLTVEEMVKKTLLEREIDRAEQSKTSHYHNLEKENSELRLAMKNRPGVGVGNSSGATSEVKDNVFSADQIASLHAMAKRLNADPASFVLKAKEDIQRRS